MATDDERFNRDQPQDARLLLRPREVASLLSVSRSTVYGWIATGNLPVVRLGTSRVARVPLDALRDWIDAQVEGGDAHR
jgi:excisionase family DNA binding protein